jgi:integrase
LRHEGRQRWVATIDAGVTEEGTRRRQTIYGRTKSEAKVKLLQAAAQPWTPPTSAVLFKTIVGAAGLDSSAWTPRELRHSFVSLLSSSGLPIEQISQLVGHASTVVTERSTAGNFALCSARGRRPWTRSSTRNPIVRLAAWLA